MISKKKYTGIPIPTLFSCISLLLLSIITTNGILLSIGLLMLGYAKHERVLSVLGSVFLGLFLIYYYYSLPYTLDYKAAILVVSGCALLASRWVIKLMKWDVGDL
jgi:uncharacterized membrane protein